MKLLTKSLYCIKINIYILLGDEKMKTKFFKLIISFALCFAIAISCTCVFNAEEANQEAKKVDIVFCIDTTGNSANKIDIIKSTLKETLNSLDATKADCQFAFIQYRDFTQKTSAFDFSYKVEDFSNDIEQINNYIDSLSLSYYSNNKNCLLSALIDGSNQLTFREDSVKAFVILGQNEFYDPEPYSGYDFSEIINKFDLSVNGYTLSCEYKFFTVNLGTNENVEKYYKYFSDYSGGKYYSVSSDDENFESNLSDTVKFILNDVIDNYGYVSGNNKLPVGEIVEDILSSVPEFLKVMLRPVVRVIVLLAQFFNW